MNGLPGAGARLGSAPRGRGDQEEPLPPATCCWSVSVPKNSVVPGFSAPPPRLTDCSENGAAQPFGAILEVRVSEPAAPTRPLSQIPLNWGHVCPQVWD